MTMKINRCWQTVVLTPINKRSLLSLLATILFMGGGSLFLSFTIRPEVKAEHDDETELPTPPSPIISKVRIDVQAADWPVGWTVKMSMSVVCDNVEQAINVYYYTGPQPPGTIHQWCWLREGSFANTYDDFYCGDTCYEKSGNNYYICEVFRIGLGEVFSGISLTEIYYLERDDFAE